MNHYQMTFERYEIKYLLDDVQYKKLLERIRDRLIPDEYGKTTICNIYFDTPDSRIIRTSLDKPAYKEKLRLRSYGTAEDHSTVFIELKKKYQGIVYKRREDMDYTSAINYLCRHQRAVRDTQILREISHFMEYYENVEPSMFISYERVAMYGAEDPELRVTLDKNILWRTMEMDLRKGAFGNPILMPGQCLMEIKIPDAMPLWLSNILDELNIYPASFSKYGLGYQQMMMRRKDGQNCA